jgi:hypothetical protein
MRKIHKVLMLLAVVLIGLVPLLALEKTPGATSPARMIVTLRVLGENKRMPEISREDVRVIQDTQRLKVTAWEPARGDRAGLDLFILIDDAADSSLGIQLDALRSFITSQPATASVGVGYMHNGTVQITQDFTSEHNQAAKAVRLPMGSSGAYGSPYLSVIELMNHWPQDNNRREVIMITDGIDRFRGGHHYHGLSFISPDADSASTVAQRTGTIIHTIFTRGVGRLASNFWEITNGQNGMAKLSDETGGESFFLGTQNAVSFKPYLDSLQGTLDNQYILEFQAIQGKKSQPKYVRLTTEIAGVEFNSADSVWVNAN